MNFFNFKKDGKIFPYFNFLLKNITLVLINFVISDAPRETSLRRAKALLLEPQAFLCLR